LVSISTLASAEDVAFLQSYTTNQISIVVGFVPDASRVIVGEPLFFTFVVSNRADQPFKFSFFGDSNFRINATNANNTRLSITLCYQTAFYTTDTVQRGESA
jgi:hypothetical protein